MALDWNPDEIVGGAARAAQNGVRPGGAPYRGDKNAPELPAMRKAVALTPAEQAADRAERLSDANLGELDVALRDTKDPAARQVLLDERKNLEAERAANPGEVKKSPPDSDAAPAASAAKPMKWAEVTAMPEYQALSAEQKEATRKQYFIDVVAPQVPTNQLDATRAAFDEDTRLGTVPEAMRTVKKTAGDAADVVKGVAQGTVDWVKDLFTKKKSVMEGYEDNAGERAGAVAPLSEQAMNRAAKVGQILGPQGVDALRQRDDMYARAVVAAADDPKRQAAEANNKAVMDQAPGFQSPEPKPRRNVTERFDEYKKNYPMMGVADIWDSIRRDREDGIDRSSPVAFTGAGKYQPTVQDWLERVSNQAETDSGHYVVPAFKRGTANLVGGLKDFLTGVLPSTVTLFQVNPILRAVGADELKATPGMQVDALDRTQYRNPPSKLALTPWDEVKGADDTARWLGEHVMEQAPQMIGMFSTALAPRVLSSLYLMGMGAGQAGTQFQENLQKHPDLPERALTEAWVEGGMEVLGEMLPLGVFHKVESRIAALTLPEKAGFIGRTMRAAGVGVTGAAAQASTEGLEEVATQIGQNLAKKYILGENVNWDDGVKEAGIIGAAAGAGMGAPHIAAASLHALTPGQGAPAAGGAGLNIPGSTEDVLNGAAATQPQGGPAAPAGNPALPAPAPIQAGAVGAAPNAEEAAAADQHAQAVYAARQAEEQRLAAANAPRALPGPDTPTGSGRMVNDGDFTRAETFEDQGHRLTGEQRLQQELDETRAQLERGLTPDVAEASRMRFLREHGLDPGERRLTRAARAPVTIDQSAAPAAAEQDARKVRAGDVTRTDGTPFPSENSALRAFKSRKLDPGLRLAKVDGGFVWREPVKKPPEEVLAKFTRDKRLELVRLIRNAGGIRAGDAGDFGVDDRTVRGLKLPGRLGPFFNENGMAIDKLSELLHQHGYLTDAEMDDGYDGADRTREIVGAVLDREYAGRVVDQGEYHDLLSAAHSAGAIEESGFNELEQPEQKEIADYDDALTDVEDVVSALREGGMEVSTEDAMRALGFTEEEIRDANPSPAEDAGAKASVQESEGPAGRDDAGGEGNRGPPDGEQVEEDSADSEVETEESPAPAPARKGKPIDERAAESRDKARPEQAEVIGRYPEPNDIKAAAHDWLGGEKVPKAADKRREFLEEYLANANRELKRDLKRYKDLREQGVDALSDYDVEIASQGHALDALGTALRLKTTHISNSRKRVAQAEEALREGADLVDVAAHEAATSPQNDLEEPSKAQLEAGNYKKGHVRINGLDITIEHPAETRRREEWPPLGAHYGYIRGTEGKDGDHVDVFVAPGTPEDIEHRPVFIVNQVREDGTFDEHKVVLGYMNEAAAKRGYLEGYPEKWKGLGSITKMSMAEFKEWLENGDKSKPVGELPAKAKPKNPAAPQDNLFEDRSGSNIDIDADVPRKILTIAPKQLAAAFNRWEKGEISNSQMLRRVEEEMARRRKRREDAAGRKRVRGPDWVKERLLRARRTGAMSQDEADLALWMLEQNPQLAEDLGIGILKGGMHTPNGDYSPLTRVFRVFTEQSNENTATHEILHHTERMMPKAVQDGIRKEWLAALRKRVAEVKKKFGEKPKASAAPKGWASVEPDADIDKEQVAAMLDAMVQFAENGEDGLATLLWKQGIKADKLPPLSRWLDYQLANPSEFWAVNAARIMRERYESADTWRRKAWKWLREFAQKVKGLFGLRSDAAVLKGLRAVTKGDGSFVSQGMITNLDDHADLGRRGIDSDDPLVQAFTELAQGDKTFQFPDTDAKSMEKVFKDMRVPVEVTDYTDNIDTSEGGTYEKVTRAWRVDSPRFTTDEDQFPRFATILADGRKKEVWLDVSQLRPGNAGMRLYQAVATWAHNNGYTFIGDPAGLSNVATYRRTEAMISSALRFGTTKHLRPHARQVVPDKALGGKTRAIDWREGEDAHNLRELLLASYHNTLGLAPELAHVDYDPGTRSFKRLPEVQAAGGSSRVDQGERGSAARDGESGTAGRDQGASGELAHVGDSAWGDEAFNAVAERILQHRKNVAAVDKWLGLATPSAGVSTLKRAVLVGHISRAEGSEQGRAILDRLAGQWLHALGSNFDGTLYKRGDAAAGAQLEALKSQAAEISRNWENGPGIEVVATPADAPFKAESDAEGAFWRGKVYLFASNLASAERAEQVIFHEALGHYGLRGFFGRKSDGGKAMDAALRQLANANAGLRRAAKAWMDKFGEDAVRDRVDTHGMSEAEARKAVGVLAIEEALADRAAAGDTFTGVKKVLAALQAGLRRLGLHRVADWLENLSDAEVSQVLAAARQYVEQGKSGAPQVLAAGALASRGGDGEALFSRAGEPGRKSLARRIVARIDSTLSPLHNLPAPEAYLTERYKALGRIAKVEEIAKGIHKAFDGATETQTEAIYQYLTTAGAHTSAIDNPELRASALRVKGLIGSVGDALVARGLLDEESREEYRDAYLPRLYMKHLLEQGDHKLAGGGRKVSDQGYLKARKDIPAEVRAVILGEITDPAFLSAVGVAKPMRDMALLDWLASISGNEQWVDQGSIVQWKGAPVTVRWLQTEASRLRKQAQYLKPSPAAKARAMAEAMEKTVAEHDSDPPDPKLYKQIPDSGRYGRLRGMWVRNEIYDDLMGVHDFLPAGSSWIQSLFGYGGVGTKVTQLWKMSKVALNPPGQVRNFIGNAVMLQLSGVPLVRLPDTMIRAWRQIVSDGKYFQIAKKYGVTAGTFSVNELGRMRTELLDLELKTKGMHPLARLKRIFAAVANSAGDLYQFSETLFKVSKIMDMMQRHKADEATAALEAHKWMFDYSLVPQAVRYARNAPVGVPFITYVYKVLPRLLEVALTAPWRFLPWMGLMYGLSAAAAAAFGVDKDELEKLRKALPEWLQDRGNAAFLPFKDELGRVQAIDLGYFFPWSQWQDFVTQVLKGNPGNAAQAAGLFSGPITDLLVAMKTGLDSFTQKPIYNKADPAPRQAADMLNYVYDMAAPPFLSSRGLVSPMWAVDPRYGGKAAQATTGTTDKFGSPRATAGQAALSLLGVNLYAVDPDHTRAQNILAKQREIEDVEKRVRQLLVDRSLTGEQRAALVKDYQAEVQKRAKELQKYMKESEVAPALKAKH